VTPGLVSIIVPVFNRSGPLVEAVGSAIGQTLRPIEIVIVDDGSTDETPEVIARLARERPDLVRAVRRQNGGPGLARETGRRAAAGEFLQYLDSDDLLLPRKLELQVEALARQPAAGVAYCACRETERDGAARSPPLRPSDRAIESMFPTFLAERWWNTVTPLYRAELCERAGPWSGLRLEEDWEYDARIAALCPGLAFVPETLAVHRDLGGERLSRGQALDPVRLADRAAAHLAIVEHAQRTAEGRRASRERQKMARALFLLSRQCGAAGLPRESSRLFAAARRLSTPESARGWDFRLYRLAALVAGWRGAGRLALRLERSRGRPRAASRPGD
jgi:glycosyltransferase involved in cell wall biosynthesis